MFNLLFNTYSLNSRWLGTKPTAVFTRKALSEFVNGKVKCSHAMARRLSEATGTGVAIWINMQAKLDTWEAENMELLGDPIVPLPL
ncbi:addiction module antidote protein, HigA family [Colwellia sp. MSW7]|nr:addiction module antidote protein, HigA family [Colwellia maritima]MCI2285457.1 addiction module antidote protein, HigA family [Colwellia maritima]